ncbi:hypothetical protein V5F38_05280 [Xanthobacter sp. V0B-10]|uniref:hypothetical protein n=1 Tax=Xanthobacter albus TaxID=3119929 RepID=UPI0037267173
MTYPDLQVPPMNFPAGVVRQEGHILGLKLVSRPRNGRLERPFELVLYGSRMEIARPVTVEDVMAIRDWCSRAISAHERALYPEAAE